MSDLLTHSPRRTLSVGTAARLLGLHPSTIRRALKSGELEGYRAGRRGMYRIPPDALDTWVRPAHQEDERT
jgi:excisionase family DNA binding protein